MLEHIGVGKLVLEYFNLKHYIGKNYRKGM